MVPQILDVLCPAPGETALDLTTGTGGHSLALAAAIGADGWLIGIDADPGALSTAEARLTESALCRFTLLHGRFSSAADLLAQAGAKGVDLAIADLGVGTHQLMHPERGFGFESQARLDMRFDPSSGPSAWDVVNGAEERQLADIFYQYGQERYSRQIAARICRQRQGRPIDTPAQLADLVKGVVARRSRRGHTWRIHPATRVMMALRIYVNHEMEELDALLEQLPELMNPSGRACVLTYHSLEARRVKHTWRRQAREELIEIITPSPLKPEADEVRANPRVRSVQLRAFRKL